MFELLKGGFHTNKTPSGIGGIDWEFQKLNLNANTDEAWILLKREAIRFQKVLLS